MTRYARSTRVARDPWKTRTFASRFGSLAAALAFSGACTDNGPAQEDSVPREEGMESTAGGSQGPGTSRISAPLCTLVGPRNETAGVYGTDLGYTTRSGPQGDAPLVVLFGDTWGEAGDACRYVPHVNDDLVGTLPAQLPARLADASAGGRSCDLVSYQLTDDQDVRSWTRVRLQAESGTNGEAEGMLPMGYLRTPVAAFTAADGVYGIFHRNEAAPCDTAADCPGSMACSADLRGVSLGTCAPVPGTPSGAARSFCRNAEDCMDTECEISARGMCLSRAPFEAMTASGPVAPDWYERDLRRGLARVMYFGRMDDAGLGQFTVVHRLATNRFVNVAVRAVAHFDPENPDENDYRTGTHTLLVWGRSAFVGERDNQALPFLMFQRMPASPSDGWQWNPQFFAGLDADGRPRWSSDEEDAQPIYGAQAELESGTEALAWTAPEFDYVNQMAVTWLEPFERWAMLYGGGAPAFLLLPDESREATVPQPAPGAIHMRHARHPWGGHGPDAAGAWSEPAPLLTPAQAAPYMVCPNEGPQALPGCLEEGDPHTAGDLLSTLAAHATELEPGAFFDVTGQCLEGQVAAGVAELSGTQTSRLYAPNVVEAWTRVGPNEDALELFWNVSTFNPYQVVLVRSALGRDMLR